MPFNLRAEDKPPTDDAILQVLRRRIDEKKKGVGIVVGWVDEHGSRVVSYGKTRLDGGTPVNGRSVFEVGSISKVFTSLLLAIAVERGEVRLDDPVEKYLPPGTKVPSNNGQQITLLDLATHRSGLPGMPDNIHPKDAQDPYVDYTPEQMFAFLSGYKLTRAVGEKFEYSNYGAALLGQALVRRAGKSYEQLLKERICQPLGMASTSITLSKDQQDRLAAPYAEDLSPAHNWNLGAFAGAGAIRSDVEDMLKFLSAELGLKASPLGSAMRATQVSRANADGEKSEIGLGWMIDHREDGKTVIWHNGGTGGYRSFAALLPERRWGVVVLSNTANEVDYVGYQLTHQPRDHAVVAIEPESADRFVGRYQIVPEFILTFSREGAHYFLQATGQGKNEVFPESEKDFFLKGIDAQISFVLDADGKSSALILHQGGDQTAKRLP